MVGELSGGVAKETPTGPRVGLEALQAGPLSPRLSQCPHGYGVRGATAQLPPGPSTDSLWEQLLRSSNLTHQPFCDPNPPSTLQFRKLTPRPIRLVLQRFWEGLCENRDPQRKGLLFLLRGRVR